MNHVTYLARVVKANDGLYAIDFPDLPGTHAQCRDLHDVQRVAEEALCSYLLAARRVGEIVPAPSASLRLKEGEMAVMVTVDLDAVQGDNSSGLPPFTDDFLSDPIPSLPLEEREEIDWED